MDEQWKPLNAAETFAACEKLWADENAQETVRRIYEGLTPVFTAR